VAGAHGYRVVSESTDSTRCAAPVADPAASCRRQAGLHRKRADTRPISQAWCRDLLLKYPGLCFYWEIHLAQQLLQDMQEKKVEITNARAAG